MINLKKLFVELRGKAVISESDLDATLREIRIALLEADVAFSCVKDFISAVKEKYFRKRSFKVNQA